MGFAPGELELAQMFLSGRGVVKDITLALHWAKHAAADGSVEAFVTIGDIYEHGYGFTQDLDEARRMYAKGSELGSQHAKDNLSRLQDSVAPAE